MDTAAAAVLAINRGDLPCITLLLVGGPATKRRIAQTLSLSISATRDGLARLELAGYVRPRGNGDELLMELIEQAHE